MGAKTAPQVLRTPRAMQIFVFTRGALHPSRPDGKPTRPLILRDPSAGAGHYDGPAGRLDNSSFPSRSFIISVVPSVKQAIFAAVRCLENGYSALSPLAPI